VGKSDHVVPSPGSNFSRELRPSNARNGCTRDQRYADRAVGIAASHCIGTGAFEMGSAEGLSMWRCEMTKIPRVVYVGILMVR
jgi:hypothetical protein